MPNNNPSKLAHLRMPDYSGSWWRLPFSHTTSMRIGKYTPITYLDIPGGSLYKVKPSIRFDSMPAVSPLYGGYTMRTKFYFAPYRLYIPELRKNRQLPWNTIPKLRFPRLWYFGNYLGSTANLDSTGVHTSQPSSLLERLGIAWGEFGFGQSYGNDVMVSPASGVTSSQSLGFRANLMPLLVYVDSWMYGEYNPQDKNIPVDTEVISVLPNITETFVSTYGKSFVSYDDLRKRMDEIIYGTVISDSAWVNCAKMRRDATTDDGISIADLRFTRNNQYFVPNYPLFSVLRYTGTAVQSYFSLFGGSTVAPKARWNSLKNHNSAVGLLPVTYKGDHFTSWYCEEGINILKDYVVTNGETFLSLRKRNDDFMVAALSLISGNRYVDYLQYIFDQELELKDHPIMVGYDEQHFGMIDVLAQSNTGDGQNGVLGARASMAREYNNSVKPLSFKTKEPGLMLVCSSIVPTVTYYRGADRFLFARAIEDVWQPPYSSQGFMETFRGEYLNPFVMPDNEGMGDSQYTTPVVNGESFPLSKLNKVAVSYVPLGWQYMQKYDTISGAVKTDAFKTWTNRKDERFASGNLIALDGSAFSPSGLSPFDEFGIESLRSTYVDSFLFNDNFVNISFNDRENFIVKFDFDISAYQPISKTLITKSF